MFKSYVDNIISNSLIMAQNSRKGVIVIRLVNNELKLIHNDCDCYKGHPHDLIRVNKQYNTDFIFRKVRVELYRRGIKIE